GWHHQRSAGGGARGDEADLDHTDAAALDQHPDGRSHHHQLYALGYLRRARSVRRRRSDGRLGAGRSVAGEVRRRQSRGNEKTLSMNLVITGFMGTGKTSVARLVARLFGRECVDMDELISAREGRPVAQVFREQGEAYFRDREAEVCRELGARDDLVIATGGGTLLSDDNRAVLARRARLFCLDASADEIARRVGADSLRPLLGATESSGSLVERITSLLKQREAAYALIPHHVGTDALTPEQVAQQVVACAQQTLSVDLQRSVRAG